MITVDVKGKGIVEFPDGTPQEEMERALKDFSEPQTTAAGTFARSVGTSILPDLGALAGGGMGMLAGAATGPGAFALSGLGALAGGAGAEELQKKGMQTFAPKFLETLEAGERQHPTAAFLGNLAGAGAVFRPSPGAAIRGLRMLGKLGPEMTLGQKRILGQAGTLFGMGAGFGVASPLLHGQMPTAKGVLESAAVTSLFGGPHKWSSVFVPEETIAASMERYNASRKQKAAEVHGNVPAQPGQGAGEVPAKEGEPRVRTESEKVAEGAPVSLEVERAALVNEAVDAALDEAKKFGLEEESVPDDTFKEGEYFKARGENKFAIHRNTLERVLSRAYDRGMGGKEMADFAREGIREEKLHNVSDAVLSKDDYVKAWQAAGPVMRAKVLKQYTGEFKRTGKVAGEYSDELLGKELVRMQLQRLTGKQTELAGHFGFEKLGVRSLDVLANTLQKIGAKLGGPNAKILQGLIDKAKEDVGVARTMAQMKGEAPLPEAANKPELKNPPSSEIGPSELILNKVKSGGALNDSELSTLKEWVNDVIKNKKTLTPEEQKVFNYYVKNAHKPAPPPERKLQVGVMGMVEAPPKPPPTGQMELPGGENPAARSDDLRGRKEFLLRAVDRYNSLIDASDRKQEYSVSANWKRFVDAARAELDDIDRQIESEGENQSFAAARMTEEERRFNAMDTLVKNLEQRVAKGTATQEMLNNAIAERERLKLLIPPKLEFGKSGEVITASAYKPKGGKEEIGRNHPEIIQRLGLNGYDSPESRNTPEFGFQTNRRKFITRDQAREVSKASGQNLKEFEPGEPVHSDEVASPKEPGKSLGDQSAPASRMPDDPAERAKYIEKYGQMSISGYLDDAKRAGRKLLPAHVYKRFDSADIGDSPPQYPTMAEASAKESGEHFFDIEKEKVVDAKGTPLSPQPKRFTWLDLIEPRELLNRSEELGVPKGYVSEIQLGEDRLRNLDRNVQRMSQQRSTEHGYVHPDYGNMEPPRERPTREQFGPPPEGTSPAARKIPMSYGGERPQFIPLSDEDQKRRNAIRRIAASLPPEYFPPRATEPVAPRAPESVPERPVETPREARPPEPTPEVPQAEAFTQIPTEFPPVPFSERGTPEVKLSPEGEAHAQRPPPTMQEIAPFLQKHIIEAEVPDYKKMYQDMRKAFGKEWTQREAPDYFLWAMWQHLQASSPERIAQYISDVGDVRMMERLKAIVRQRVSPRELTGWGGFSEEQAEEAIEKFKDVPKRKALTPEQQEKLVEALKRPRRPGAPDFLQEARSVLGAKLLQKVVPFEEKPTYEPKPVSIDSMDFENVRAHYPGYYEFKTREAGDPEFIRKVLSDRIFAEYPGAPNQASNRLVALRDRKTRAMELATVWSDPRRGLLIHNPVGKDIPITELPPEKAFHGTILLKEPRRGFYEKFRTIQEYNSAIDRLGSLRQSVPTRGEYVPTRRVPIEDISNLHEGGLYMGPGADIIRASAGMGRGELESISANPQNYPMELPEALALHRLMRAMEVSNPQDVYEMVRIMDELGARDELQPFHYQAIAALMKLAEAIRLKDPSFTAAQLAEATVNTAYEEFRPKGRYANKAQFASRLLVDYDWERLNQFRTGIQPTSATTPSPRFVNPFFFGPRGTAGAAVQQAQRPLQLARKTPAPVELSYTKPAGAIPTRFESLGGRFVAAVRAESKPFIGPVRPEPMPTATPGTIAGPEMLAEPVLSAMEQMEKGPRVAPEGKTIEGGPVEREPQQAPPLDITKAKPTGQVEEFKGIQYTMPRRRLLGPRTREVERLAGESAAARAADEYIDEWHRMRKAIGVALSRQLTEQNIKAFRDGRDRIGEVYSVRGSNTIRLSSRGETVAKGMEAAGFKTFLDRKEFRQVRESVNAYQAAMQMTATELRNAADAARREWSVRKAIAQERNQPFAEPEPQYVPPTEPNPKYFDDLAILAEKGMEKGRERMRSPNASTVKTGRRGFERSKQLLDLISWTKEHMRDPAVILTNEATRKVWEEDLRVRLQAGESITDRDYYYPTTSISGETDALWDDGMFTAGDPRVMGSEHQGPRAFSNLYQAVAEGYIPLTLDMADIMQHSLLETARRVGLKLWADDLKDITDPSSGKPVAIAADQIPKDTMVKDPRTGLMEPKREWIPVLPKGAEMYDLMKIGRESLGVRRGYGKVVKAMMAESAVPDMPYMKEALFWSAFLKHSLVLLGDTFHPMRLLQYSSALGGGNIGLFPSTPRWKRGWSALSWARDDIPEAVRAGIISQKQADWALEPVKVHQYDQIITTNRHDLATRFLTNGFNATQQADMLYRSAVQKMPVIGNWWFKNLVEPLTKFTFDRLTPGLMVDNAVSLFEKYNARHHGNIDEQMRLIARDVNAFYGNMGRQGFFSNPTFRDLFQIVVLAPLWQEGLLRKEFTTLSRVSGVSYLAGRRAKSLEGYLGPLTFGMMRGLGTYFLLTQMMNLITRRQFTWQNKEEGHAMDSYVPTPWEGEGAGIWISPLGVFAEWMHDYIRLYEKQPNAWKTLMRIGANKSGPLGRILGIVTSMKTPSGEEITTTGGVAKAAAGEMLPMPIGGQSIIKDVGSRMGLTSPPQPGATTQRLLAAGLGMKTQVSSRPEQDISMLADRWMRKNNYKVEMYDLVPTDNPSYAKLRAAIRNKDLRGADKMLEELRKNRSNDQILKAMKLWSSRPFTGNHKAEQLFLFSLTDPQLETYYHATGNRMQLYSDFLNFFMSR